MMSLSLFEGSRALVEGRMVYSIAMLRLLFHVENVKGFGCLVPESQSAAGGIKSVCEGPVAGGKRRLMLDDMANRTDGDNLCSLH